MKTIKIFNILFIFLTLCFNLMAADVNKKVINQTFNDNIQIKLFTSNPISGLTISGNIQLNSDSSLIRVILIDNQYKEYLVHESYRLISSSDIFSITDIGEETSLLYNIIPLYLELKIIDAAFTLNTITFGKPSLIAKSLSEDQLQQENLKKIKKLNENIKKKGELWTAGETSVSKMTYEEKKQFFGGTVPPLRGFEYYIGGVFNVNVDLNTPPPSFSLCVDNFSWRNRNGKNWMTSVKNQGGCGSCWAFGVIGATELATNLYYNKQLNLDLAEQELVSNISGYCSGAYPYLALNFIKLNGVVNESCFPYQAYYKDPNHICPNPSENIKISDYTGYPWGQIPNNEDELKKSIIKGASTFGYTPWNHVMTLVGYMTLSNGQTAWLVKNSWGTGWGDNGYSYMTMNLSGAFWFHSIIGPITSLNYKNTDIACEDNDNDGYYIWGTGSKPSYCPPCPDQQDGDDSNPCLGPIDQYGNIQPISKTLKINDTVICYNSDLKIILKVIGDSIKWYDNNNVFILSDTIFKFQEDTVGSYVYYVTQFKKGCESFPVKVTVTINPLVDKPITSDVFICEEKSYNGKGDYSIRAIGNLDSYIRWYDNENLNNLIGTGEILPFTSSIIDTCRYFYYATQTINGCQSESAKATVIIKPNPKPIASNVFMCKKSNPLTAIGNSLYWYVASTYEKNQPNIPIHCGDSLYTSDSIAGTYFYCVTQMTGNCQSDTTNVSLTINAIPSQPQINNLYICEGKSIPVLTTIGESLKWYNKTTYIINSDLNIPIHCGDSLYTSDSIPGTYFYCVTQTINKCESDTANVSLTIKESLPQPLVNNDIICEGDTSILIGKGDSLKWYNKTTYIINSDLNIPIHCGDSLYVNKIPGKYFYCVTQTINKCESDTTNVSLTINAIPSQPQINNLYICEGKSIPVLTTIGDSLKWYDNLNNLINNGNSLLINETLPNLYTYYVTQTVNECESSMNLFTVRIYPNPIFNLGNDTTINYSTGTLTFDIPGFSYYLWNNNSQDSLRTITGKDFSYPGDYIISLFVMNEYACYYSDTIKITIIFPSDINTNKNKDIIVYPNPVMDIVNIKFKNEIQINIQILSQDGKQMINKNLYEKENTLDVSFLLPGIYIMRITKENQIYNIKLIKKS